LTSQHADSNSDLAEAVRSFLTAHSEIIRVGNRFTVKKSPFTVRLPVKLSQDLCWIIGILQGDGNISGTRIHVSEESKEFHTELRETFEKVFGIQLHLYRDGARNTYYSYVKSTIISDFLKDVFKLCNGRKTNQEIPKLIRESTVYRKSAYVSGLFDAEGYLSKRQAAIGFSVSDRSIAEFVSRTLSEIGVKHLTRSRFRSNRRPEHVIEVYGRKRVKRFLEKVGFRHPLKLTRSWYD
jgi:intein/homing endonuclease